MLVTAQDISFGTFIFHRMTFMALFASAVDMWAVSYFSSFLSLRFKSHYGMKDYQMGYYNLFLSGPYLFCCLLLTKACKDVPKRLQFVLCFIGCTIGSILMGPTFVPDHLTVVCAGMLLVGSVVSLTTVNCLPEAIDLTQIRFRVVEGVDKELDSTINDTLSSLFTTIFSTGSLLSPIIGGYLYDQFGYVITTQVSAVLMTITTLIYFTFNCGFSVYSDAR